MCRRRVAAAAGGVKKYAPGIVLTSDSCVGAGATPI